MSFDAFLASAFTANAASASDPNSLDWAADYGPDARVIEFQSGYWTIAHGTAGGARYTTILGNEEHIDAKLADAARHLYQYAKGEHMLPA
tara:strand:- start:1857 stop:2126 length:270 start_codon:yes stop_codon:yes gene_type:complete